MFNKHFDLIVSIGATCGCALWLKKFKLRDHSYPFDWLCNASFDTRIELIANDFENFLQRDATVSRGEPNSGDRHNELYEDLNTGFHFLHDFPNGVPFEEAYRAVRAKYERRISRLYEKIFSSNNVLLVWFSLFDKVDDATILASQKTLSEKFSKEIHLLIIQHNSDCTALSEVKLGEYAMKVEAPFRDGIDNVMGDGHLGSEVYRKIKAQKKYLYVILRALMRLSCCLIPSGKLRRKLRTGYENKW
ncbi:MAG: hypothetical protein IJY48_02855 [Mailhella sp.]|nr:hypothetical protein [Mailhella sp.]